jgi:tripartite ATP-independent transporter DctM subunit
MNKNTDSAKNELFAHFARVAKALASPVRMELLEALAQGERSVDELARAIEIPMANTSHHLQVLRDGGLVSSRRDGIQMIYRLTDEKEVTGIVAGIRRVAEAQLADVDRIVRQVFARRDSVLPVDHRELRRLARSGAVTVIDVRPSNEFAAGHVKGAINVPVALAIAMAGLSYFLLSPELLMGVFVQRLMSVTSSFPLLAVPFFILAGNLMNATGITERLLVFARLLTGWMNGGLAQVSIMLSALMGGISGSAVADAAMESRLLGPTMEARGYARGFTASAIAFSSLITATIPPSIGLILFGFISEVSIGRLLLGGIVPGILMTVTLMLVTSWIARRMGYRPELAERPRFREVATSFLDCIWALMFPVLLLVGFRFGLFTATEAGAVVVLYALVVGTLIYRELNWTRLIGAMRASIFDIGMVMLIIVMAAVLGHALTIERAPSAITGFLAGLPGDRYITLFVVLAIIFVAGTVMEATVNVLLVTPLVLPALVTVGFDPVHMGVVMIILVTLGGTTPPVGVIMYTVCGILRCDFAEFVRWSWPFMAAMVALIAVMALVPGIVLFLPDLLM